MALLFAGTERHFGKGEVRDITVTRAEDGGLIVGFSRAYGTEYPLPSPNSVISFDAMTSKYRDIPVTFGQTSPHQAIWCMTTIHNAWFAGAGLRWLLFVAAILSCAMITAGLVLWTVKRHEKHARGKETPFSLLSLRAAERLNVGVIAGLSIGVAAYF